MKITRITTGVIKNPTTKVVGMATIEIDEIMVLNNIKIINGEKGFFLGMPSMKTKNESDEDKYKDVFYFKSEKAKEYLTAKVVESYIAKLEEYQKEAGFEEDNGDMPF